MFLESFFLVLTLTPHLLVSYIVSFVTILTHFKNILITNNFFLCMLFRQLSKNFDQGFLEQVTWFPSYRKGEWGPDAGYIHAKSQKAVINKMWLIHPVFRCAMELAYNSCVNKVAFIWFSNQFLIKMGYGVRY